jgi:hypothetical protein
MIICENLDEFIQVSIIKEVHLMKNWVIKCFLHVEMRKFIGDGKFF